MKLLICSADLHDLTQVVKRLVSASIPCAICKDPGGSHLSVWIQQDVDFPLALRVVMNREGRPRAPHWARALDVTHPAALGPAVPVLDRIEPPVGLVVQPTAPTWTATAGTPTLAGMPQRECPARLAPHPSPSADLASRPTVDEEELAGSESS